MGLVLLGIAVALGSGEIGLRALGWTGLDEGREAYQFDPELGWTLRPQISVRRASAEYQHQVATGPHGFRGDPPRGAARTVVVLGDSFVEAFQVPRAHTFVARLDEALGPDTQVLNYGVSGYAPDQEALLWQRLAPTVPAQDVVLLVYGANDVLGVLRDRGHGMAKPVVTEVPRDDGPRGASGPALVPPAQGDAAPRPDR